MTNNIQREVIAPQKHNYNICKKVIENFTTGPKRSSKTPDIVSREHGSAFTTPNTINYRLGARWDRK